MQPIETQLLMNYLTVELIQWAKNSTHPLLGWVSSHSSRINKIIAAIAAALTAAGISWHYSGGALTIENLTAGTLLAAGVALLKNWIGLKLIYKVLYPATLPAMASTAPMMKGNAISGSKPLAGLIVLAFVFTPGCAAQHAVTPPAEPPIIGGPAVNVAPRFKTEIAILVRIQSLKMVFDRQLAFVDPPIAAAPLLRIQKTAARISDSANRLAVALAPGTLSDKQISATARTESRRLAGATRDLARESFYSSISNAADRSTLANDGKQMQTLTAQLIDGLKAKGALK